MVQSVIDKTADEVIELLPRVPRSNVEKTILRVWSHFCRRSMVWSKDYYFNRTAGEYRYTITIKENAHVHKVDGLYIRTDQDIADNKRGHLLPSNLYRCFMNDRNQLVINLSVKPSDTLANGYTIRVVLVPQRDAKVSDEALFERYQEGILGGVISDLARRPGRPWTNYPMANEYRTEFFRAISRGLAVRAKGLSESQAMLESL